MFYSRFGVPYNTNSSLHHQHSQLQESTGCLVSLKLEAVPCYKQRISCVFYEVGRNAGNQTVADTNEWILLSVNPFVQNGNVLSFP